MVDALGRIGSRDALEKLEAWRDDARSEWQDMKVYVARAIARIRGGNPDSQQLDAQRR